MKKRGIFLGTIFVMLMVVIFQSELSTFMTAVREKATEAAQGGENTVSALEELNEEENDNTTDTDEGGSAPPLPDTEDSETTTDENSSTDEEVTADVTYTEVLLYFVDEQNQAIATEEREIVKSDGIAKATLTTLLEGPQSASLTSYIPEGTELNSMNISGGLCTVDFNEKLKNEDLTSSEERYVISSIVETLCQFDSVDKVQIRIDGTSVQTLAGHWDISKPLSPTDFE